MNFVIKVADFGLAESVETREYFRQDKSSHIKLPLRWLAPESMDDYMFSEKSDVVSLRLTCCRSAGLDLHAADSCMQDTVNTTVYFI
jgi:hypothetical protein